MNYEKIYNQLIYRAQFENRQKGCGVYFESHHIVPKCLGGNNDKTNLVLLTAREHYVAHKLLCEVHPDETKLHYALWRMMNVQNLKHDRTYNISSKEYSRCKQIQSKLVQQLGKQNTGKINVISEETRNKMKIAKLGKPRSNETKEKISNTLTGFKQKPESIELRRSKLKGSPGYWKGKQRSAETKEKIRQTILNKNK
jgi:hypothetical protein